MSTTSIKYDFHLPHPPEKVWAAIANRASMEKWLMPNDFEPRVGHRFTFRTQPNPQAGFDGIVHCEVLECAPPSQLAYSWAGGGIDTRVSYRLEPDGGGTRVFFEQSGFDLARPWGENALRGAEYGWTMMLERLSGVVAALTARP